MRLIDDNGRLFGKINVIDFLIILFLFFLAPMFYFGYKVFTKKPPAAISKEFVEVEMPCVFIKVDPKILGMVKQGDTELDLEGQKIGEIVSIGEPKPYLYKFDIGVDDFGLKRNILIEDTKSKELPVKLKIKAEVRGNGLYYNGKSVSTGSLFGFRTNKYSVAAQLAIPQPPIIENWIKVKVKFPGVSSELASLIVKGHREKDDSGRVVGRLNEVLAKKPSEIQALKLEENRMIFVADPYRNDIEASLDLLCTKKEDGWYYRGIYPIKIGSQINFSSDFFVAPGIIVGISKAQDADSAY